MKRLTIFACLLLLIFHTAAGASGEAEEYTASGSARLNEQEDGTLARLFDRNAATKIRLPEKGELRVECPSPVGSVYLVWDSVPAACALTAQTENFNLSAGGFLHAFIPFESTYGGFTLAWSGAEGTLCDVYLFGPGEAPAWVERWEAPDAPADLLLLPTHADDELLFFGGTMPLYAARGDVRIQVAYMVQHGGEPYRPHELLRGLWTVGVRRYPVIPPFPDIYSESLEHAKTVYDENAVTAYQVELLRRFRPLVVVGHDENGEYGHGGHRLNTDCLKKSLVLAADPDSLPESARRFGVWDTPKTYLHLYAQRPVVMNWDLPLERFGGASAFEVASRGYDCHVSQHAYFSMDPAGPFDCRKFGLYRTTVGDDREKNDFFENIPWPRNDEEDLLRDSIRRGS